MFILFKKRDEEKRGIKVVLIVDRVDPVAQVITSRMSGFEDEIFRQFFTISGIKTTHSHSTKKQAGGIQ